MKLDAMNANVLLNCLQATDETVTEAAFSLPLPGADAA